MHSAPGTDLSPELSYFSIFVSLFLALIFASLLKTCAPIHPSLSHVKRCGAHGEQFGTRPKQRPKYYSNLSAQNKSFPEIPPEAGKPKKSTRSLKERRMEP